jgi:hypothetical protein
VDVGELQGGQVIGKIKEILDSYSDANELYDEFMINTMAKVLFMNDQESYGRHTKLLTGSYR